MYARPRTPRSHVRLARMFDDGGEGKHRRRRWQRRQRPRRTANGKSKAASGPDGDIQGRGGADGAQSGAELWISSVHLRTVHTHTTHIQARTCVYVSTRTYALLAREMYDVHARVPRGFGATGGVGGGGSVCDGRSGRRTRGRIGRLGLVGWLTRARARKRSQRCEWGAQGPAAENKSDAGVLRGWFTVDERMVGEWRYNMLWPVDRRRFCPCLSAGHPFKYVFDMRTDGNV